MNSNYCTYCYNHFFTLFFQKFFQSLFQKFFFFFFDHFHLIFGPFFSAAFSFAFSTVFFFFINFYPIFSFSINFFICYSSTFSTIFFTHCIIGLKTVKGGKNDKFLIPPPPNVWFRHCIKWMLFIYNDEYLLKDFFHKEFRKYPSLRSFKIKK